MKGHVKLAGIDLSLVRDPRENFIYRETHRVPQELQQLYQQSGAIPIGQDRFYFGQNDFAGGFGEDTNARRDMLADIQCGRIKFSTTDNFDQRLLAGKFLTFYDEGGVIGTTVKVIHADGGMYIHLDTGSVYWFDGSTITPVGVNCIALCECNNAVYAIDTDANRTVLRLNGAYAEEAGTVTTSYDVLETVFPFIAGFTGGDVHILRPALFEGPLAVKFGSTDGSSVEITEYERGVAADVINVETSPCAARVYPVFPCADCGKPDLFRVETIDATKMPMTSPDILIIEYIGETASYTNQGFDPSTSKRQPIMERALSLLGFNEQTATGWIENMFYQRLARGTNWLNIGEYDQSTAPSASQIPPGFHKMAVPIKGAFKLYWASNAEIQGTYTEMLYRFHVGESISLTHMGDTDVDIMGSAVVHGTGSMAGVCAIEVAEDFQPSDVLRIGDKWYIQFIPAGSFGTLNVPVPQAMPCGITLTADTSQDQGPVIRTANCLVLNKQVQDSVIGHVMPDAQRSRTEPVEGIDWTHNTASGTIVSLDPIYGCRLAYPSLLQLRLLNQSTVPLPPDFTPDSLTGSRLVLAQQVKGMTIKESNGYLIVGNTSRSVFPKDAGLTPGIAVRGTYTAAIVDSIPDYTFKGAYRGTAIRACQVGNQACLLTEDGEFTRVYLVDRRGVAEIDHVKGTPLACHGFLETIVYAVENDGAITVYAPEGLVVCKLPGHHLMFQKHDSGVLAITETRVTLITQHGVCTPFESASDLSFVYDQTPYNTRHESPMTQNDVVACSLPYLRVGNDAGYSKRLVAVRVTEAGATSEASVSAINEDGIVVGCLFNAVTNQFEPTEDFSFKDVTIEYRGTTLDALSAIGIVFIPEDNAMEHIYRFAFPLNKNVLDFNGTPTSKHYEVIKQLCETNTLVDFYDIEGRVHSVKIKELEVQGQPAARQEADVAYGTGEGSPDEKYQPNNSYVVVVTLVKK